MVKIAVTEYGCGSLFFMLFSAIDFCFLLSFVQFVNSTKIMINIDFSKLFDFD